MSDSRPADAQLDCSEPVVSVSTAAEFNAAIDCLNQAVPDAFGLGPGIVVSLTADIAAGSEGFTPMTQPAQSGLVIFGNGHTVRRSATPSTPGPLLTTTFSSYVALWTEDLVIEVGPGDTHGVLLQGQGALKMDTTAVTAASVDQGAVGVGIEGAGSLSTHTITDSIIDGLAVGISASEARLAVEATTVSSTGTDVMGQPLQVEVRRSTFTGPVGFEIGQDSFADFAFSTVLNDAAAVAPQTSFGGVTFESSIIGECTAPFGNEFPLSQDNGNNVGGCLFPGQMIDTTLADNGCAAPTPIGCPQTVALSADAAAIGAGDCSNPSGGYNLTDQRGQERTPVGAGCDAGAFESLFGADCSTSPRFVSTAAEFNEAIVCNRIGGVDSIVLQADIEATDLAANSVFEPITGPNELLIDGGNHTLRRSPSAADTQLPLLVVENAPGVVNIVQTNIEVGEFDTIGIDHTAGNRLHLRGSSIQAGANGTSATGARTTSGMFIMEDSLISSMPIGVDIVGSITIVEDSTITATATDIRSATISASGVSNSVLGGPVGIEFVSGTLHVEHSTILGDAALPSAAAAEDSFVTLLSSIAQSCTATEVVSPTQFGPGWVDLGYNVGGCVDIASSPTLTPVQLCAEPTAGGCLPTAEIGPFDAAIEAGHCDDGSLSKFGPAEFDHQGEPRTPVGAGCDAGAYEYSGPVPNCQADGLERYTYEVSTTAELNEAIICHNQSAANTNVVLLNDIVADSVAGDSVFERVTRGNLTIAGEAADASEPLLTPTGFTLSRGQAAGTEPLPLLAGDEGASVYVALVHLELGPYDTFGIQADTGVLSLGAITSDNPHPNAVGISVRGGFVGRSIIRDVSVGFEQVADTPGGGFVPREPSLISGSTISSTDTDVRLLESGAKVSSSTLAGPTGIVFHTQTIVEDSTILGDAAVPAPNGPGIYPIVEFSNSIANTCTANQATSLDQPGWTDNGGNTGACFPDSTFVTTDPLRDNGCNIPTPIGCPRTAALPGDSVARGAGDCGTGSLDQRGEPRTPDGPGCDSGAFEAAPLYVGDVDGNDIIDNADVQAILEWLAGGDEPIALHLGDWNNDGAVRLDDALEIATLIADGFPAGWGG